MTSPALLTVAATAERLAVPAAFVRELLGAERFRGVVTLANGHRRIPSGEVDRVRRLMRARRRHVLLRLGAVIDGELFATDLVSRA